MSEPISSSGAASAPPTEVTPISANDPASERLRELEAIIGKTVSDRYRITALIGSGGMGAVYEAEHTGIGKKVAIKFLTREAARENTVASRFAREARAASAIESEHIVTVFDAGTDENLPYIAMELLRGEDFGARLRRLGKVPQEDAVHVIAQVLRGLADAHEAGIIHRDLKPDNVFLVDKRGDTSFVKIVDFGVSKFDRPGMSTAPLALTQKGTVVGTPYYMSPEQAQAAPDLDARADLFSVGAMLFEALAGRPPHMGTTYEAVIVSICMNDSPDLRTLVPEISPGLARFVARALARDRKSRFSSARQMLVALAEFAPRERMSGDAEMKRAPPASHSDPTMVSPQTPAVALTAANGPESGEPRRTSTSWIAADKLSAVSSRRLEPTSKKTLFFIGAAALVTGIVVTMLLVKTLLPSAHVASSSSAAVASSAPQIPLSAEHLAPASAAIATASAPVPTASASDSQAAPRPSATAKPKNATGKASSGRKKTDDIDRDFP
ncbi:MAG: serine/threonine-protein kinase [Polyangiaceae bacterium]